MTEKKRFAALLSGGKDSVLAVHLLVEEGYELVCCVTVESEDQYSYLYHAPNVELAALSAQAFGVPHIRVKTKGGEEAELQALHDALTEAKDKHDFAGVSSGALASQYQGSRYGKICDSLGLDSYNPLWRIDQVEELKLVLAKGLRAIFTRVAAEGLDASWLGKELTPERIETLERLGKDLGVQPGGEGGEYETLVLDAPLYSQRIVIGDTEPLKDGPTVTLSIKEAHLAPK